jgi:enoyl-CoA hydratase
VDVSLSDGIATVRLAREHGNAIDETLAEDLLRACRDLGSDPSVRGALLAASGKLFCPGLDLRDLLAYDRPSMARFLATFSDMVLALYMLPLPVCAAIEGHALAGGLILALTADWRVLRQGALVGLNEVRVGVPLPFGVALLVREAVPPGRREEVALLGRNYAGEAAVAAGLVHEVHEGAGFEAHCRTRLGELAARDRLAFARTKEYLRAATAERFAREDASHRDEFLDCWFSPGTRGRIEEIVAGLGSGGR